MLICVHHLDPPVLDHARAPLAAAGAPLIEAAPAAGDPLPRLDGADGIVVFGGAQSVLDLAEDPMLADEATWIADATARGIPVLGVCLGAQLLAHALGGSVFRLPRRRLSWEPLHPTPAAAGDPVFGALPPGAHGLHWNEDGLEPPPGAVELLARDGRPGARAFRHGDAAWGVQFHPEIGARSLDHWYAAWPSALEQAGADEARARARDREHLGGQATLAQAIFGGFADVVAARRESPGTARPGSGAVGA